MIALTAQTRIWIAREPADFRCGIDGLAKICRTVLKSDPFSGALFVFRNRRSKSIKILSYNSRGFWLCQKRLSKGRFRWWPESDQASLTRRLTNCSCCWRVETRQQPKASPCGGLFKKRSNVGRRDLRSRMKVATVATDGDRSEIPWPHRRRR
jgi:transposase